MQIGEGWTGTHTSTCSHFARGSLFRNGSDDDDDDQLAIFLSVSPPLANLRVARRDEESGRAVEGGTAEKKRQKGTKVSVTTPSPLRAPASCGSFRLETFRRPVASRRFPLKSASHGGSFTNFTTKFYTTGMRKRRASAIPI